MSREYSHKDPSPGRAGEWDTPARHRRDSSLAKSGWSTRSDSTRQAEQQQQLTVAAPRAPLPRSHLRQEVLPEEEYIAHLSDIIQRDFFPHLRTLETQQNVLDAIDSQDSQRIYDTVQRMRSEAGRTPTVRRSRQGSFLTLQLRIPRAVYSTSSDQPACSRCDSRTHFIRVLRLGSDTDPL